MGDAVYTRPCGQACHPCTADWGKAVVGKIGKQQETGSHSYPDTTTRHQQNQTNSHLVTGIVASPDRTPTLMDKRRYNEYDMIESNKKLKS